MPTRSEELIWTELRGRRLGPKFGHQHPIGPFIVDFCCPQLHLIVEIDGPIHQTQQDEDTARQTALEARGYHFLRLPASLVEDDPSTALARIRTAIAALECVNE